MYINFYFSHQTPPPPLPALTPISAGHSHTGIDLSNNLRLSQIISY